MFFGKGDSARLDEAQLKTLSHLRRLVETGHIIGLTPDQSEMAIRAIEFYSQWDSLARLGRSIRNTGILVTGLLALWWVAQDNIVEFIQRIANG